MKKTLILFSILLLLFLLFPFIGNAIVKENIDNKIELLTSYGVDVEIKTDKVGYLNTKKEIGRASCRERVCLYV